MSTFDPYQVATVLELACQTEERTAEEQIAMQHTAGVLDVRGIKPQGSGWHSYAVLVEQSLRMIAEQ